MERYIRALRQGERMPPDPVYFLKVLIHEPDGDRQTLVAYHNDNEHSLRKIMAYIPLAVSSINRRLAEGDADLPVTSAKDISMYAIDAMFLLLGGHFDFEPTTNGIVGPTLGTLSVQSSRCKWAEHIRKDADDAQPEVEP